MAKKSGKITIEKLAMMINNGFEDVKGEIQEFKRQNAKEHEEMSLRLDNVAYRFELVDLQRRVERLEKTANIKNRV